MRTIGGHGNERNIGLLAAVNTNTYTHKMVGGLAKVKQTRRHRRWSLVQLPSQSLLQVGSVPETIYN